MSELQQPSGNEQCVQCAMSFTVIQCHPMSTNVIQCHPMSLCAIQCHPIGNWFWCFHFDFFLVGYRVIKKSNLCIISGNLRILRRENNTTSKYQLKIWKTRKNHNSVSHFMNWTRYALPVKAQMSNHLITFIFRNLLLYYQNPSLFRYLVLSQNRWWNRWWIWKVPQLQKIWEILREISVSKKCLLSPNFTALEYAWGWVFEKARKYTYVYCHTAKCFSFHLLALPKEGIVHFYGSVFEGQSGEDIAICVVLKGIVWRYITW